MNKVLSKGWFCNKIDFSYKHDGTLIHKYKF